MKTSAASQDFFDDKYRFSSDPWAFSSSEYELNRYDSMLNAIRFRHYGKAFEPGCSIGVFTSRLALLCDEVIATDISPLAVRLAKERCSGIGNVTILCEKLPDCLASGPLDLIVFSEVGYYLQEKPLRSLAKELTQLLSASGVLLAAHWLGHSDDHILDGDQVHAVLRKTEGLVLDYEERHAGFRLDRWVKP